MPNRISAKVLFFLAIFVSSFLPFSSAVEKPDPLTLECSSTLFGTSSKDHCEKLCKNGGTEYKCFKLPGILDKECYTCARDQYCSDLGFITSWDCAICDANPATECVSAGVTLPGIGGTIGGKTWSGVQCYKCVAKPDRCNQRWPGTSWLAACQANCAPPNTCILAGIHQGNACFKCQKAPKDCKAMGLLTNAQCGPCNANPATQCIWAGMDEKFQACFQCVPKNVPPPPPPPPRNCHEAGYLDNCNACISAGKGCNFVSIAPNIICAQCYDRPPEKRCEPPSISLAECADCIKRGGQCIPKSQVRGDPPCYTCYIPPEPKKGCAKYSMFNGCTPNPCSGSEECVIVQPEPNLSCGVCQYKEGPVDTICEERRMWPDCSSCYRAHMACRNVFVPDKNIWCHRCYTPDDTRQCGDGEWPGACTESSCPSGQTCFDADNNCHRCEGKGKCTDVGYINCQKDCAACEKEPTMMCKRMWFSKDDGDCCRCAVRPVGDECQQGTVPGVCPGSCTSQQECKNVGTRCHACLNKDDKCEKYGAYSQCSPDPCDPETEVCDTMRPDPKPGLYCYACKPKAEWCSQYGNYFPSCSPNPCQPGERCQMTGVTMSSVECAKCISKEEDEKMCEKYELADGACTSSTCSAGFECNDINMYGNKCHKCECEHGTYNGGCSVESCGEGDKCIETVPGKCHRCDNAGTCQENNLYNCKTDCEDCEAHGDNKCVPSGISKSDGDCCRCVQRIEEDCEAQGALPGVCPRGCSSQQECRNVGNRCHVCLEKEDTCEKYGALTSCNQNSCNPETEVCDSLRPGPKPGLYCYGCKTKAQWCSEFGNYFPSCSPNPCKEGERCEMTGVTMSSVECAKCVTAEEDEKMCEKYELADGICTSSTCSSGFECSDIEILGNKCHKCECEHGTYNGGCSGEACNDGEKCIETVPGKCHRCDNAGTCQENNLYNCKTDCEDCEKYGDNKCVPAGMTKSDGACCRCVDRINAECPQDSSPGVCPRGCHNDEICINVDNQCHRCVKKTATCPEGTVTGACTPSSCSSDQKCVDAGGNCHTCELKECLDYGHLPSCLQCDLDNHDCEDIEPRPGLTCHECKINPCSPNFNKDQCAECERQGGVCQSLSGGQTRERGKPECFKCVPKPVECPQGTSSGVCTQSSCSSNQECVPAGENCYRCQIKKKTCEDMGLMYGDGCVQSGCIEDGGKCVQKTQDEYGSWCWGCSLSAIEPGGCKTDAECDDGAFCNGAETCNPQDGKCVPGNPPCHSPHCDEAADICGECTTDADCNDGEFCNGQETCHEEFHYCVSMGNPCDAGETCYEPTDSCISWTSTWCPPGFFSGACPADCDHSSNCISDMDYPNCHFCDLQPTFTQPQCDQGYQRGSCPGSCSSQQECVQAGQCYTCREKKKTCNDLGLLYGDDCNPCVEKGGKCVKKTEDEFGISCWECQTSQGCTPGYEPGGCFGMGPVCGFGSFCHQDDKLCHKCVPVDSGPCAGKGLPGVCPGYCSAGEECVPVGDECHTCREKPRTETGGGGGGEPGGGTGYLPGGGVGYDWKDKYKLKAGFDYTPGDIGVVPGGGGTTTTKKTCGDHELAQFCGQCYMIGMTCGAVVQVEGVGQCYKCEPNRCAPDYYTWEDCEECEWDDGYCVPASVNMETRLYGTAECYKCVERPQCEDYGTFCNCAVCPPGTACIPAGRLETGKMCYHCVRAVTFVGPFIVVVLEDPPTRYVLKGKAGESGFSPSSVLALMKVGQDKLSQIQKIAELAKGGIKAFSVGSLQDLAGILQKQRSFGQGCFNNSFSEAPLPQSAPASGQKKSPAPPSFGKSEADEAVIDGPIVACGKMNGVDALSFFDMSGAKAATLLKDEIMKDPNSVLAPLQKAQAMNDKLMELRSLTPQKFAKAALKKVTATLAEKIMPSREAPKDKKEKTSNLDPNDPLYMQDGGKPKSQVKDRMKKVVGSLFEATGGNVAPASEKKGPDVEDQWGLAKIGYTPKSDPNSAWNVIDGRTKNVIVAVIDSGLDMTHPDGPQYIWTNEGEVPDNGVDDEGDGYVDDVYGWNFINDNNDLTDNKGHGTFVAGIIAAKANNGVGIAGINPGAVIMPLKAADANGQANSFNIYRAINFAVDHGARVINVSLGARGISKMEQSAINYAKSRGVFVSVAAGNVNENMSDHGPAAVPGAFAVGALDYAGNKSTISNWGANNGLIAPAEEIYSIRSKDSYEERTIAKDKLFYYTQSGTSFSSPMVAATASLMLAQNPALTNTEMEDILHATAEDLYDEGWDSDSGAGLLNAAEALRRGPDNLLTVKITKLRINKDKDKKIESVDVYGIVRGGMSQFTVELGKGKRPGDFKEVAGPFNQPADNVWIARIDADFLKGSDDWVVRLNVQAKDGKAKFAQGALPLKAPERVVE